MVRLLVAMVVMGCAGRAAERNTLDSIPKAAAQTVRAQAHGMAITRVERETENGEEVFEAVWFEVGVRHEAKVTASGRLIEHEVAVAASAVPAAVRETAERQLGKGVTYERLMNGNYEAEVESREIEIAANGTVMTPIPPIEDDDGEDNDDVGD